MKPIITLIVALSFLSSCTGSKTGSSKQDSVAVKDKTPKLKTLSEVKMTLLDARLEKAIMYLGIPDKKGTVSFGATPKSNGYMVYFNKVLDNGQVKNLLIIIESGYVGIDDRSPIGRIEALSDGETAHGVTNDFTDLTITNKKVKCNCGMFTTDDGKTEWYKLE